MSRKPLAIAPMRCSSRVNRSMNAASRPLPAAASMSSRFASRISTLRVSQARRHGFKRRVLLLRRRKRKFARCLARELPHIEHHRLDTCLRLFREGHRHAFRFSTMSSRWIELGVATVAENICDFTALAANDSACILMAIGRRGRGRLPGRRRFGSPPHRRARSGLRSASRPAGKRLFPEVSAVTAPASTISAPRGSSVPAIQRLRAATGSECGKNQVPPFAQSALSGFITFPLAITIWVPAPTAIFAAAIFVTMPPRESSEPSIARHRFDLGRDLARPRRGGARRRTIRAAAV